MKIISKLDQRIYGTQKRTFYSPYSLQEVISRLSSRVYSPSLLRRYRDTLSYSFFRKDRSGIVLEGKVNDKRVFLVRYARGFGRTTFRLVFRGKFNSRDNMTILDGNFSVAPLAKAISVLWIGMALNFVFDMVIPALQANATSAIPILLLFLLIILLSLLAFMWYGRWISRDDIQIISDEIGNAMGDSTAS